MKNVFKGIVHPELTFLPFSIHTNVRGGSGEMFLLRKGVMEFHSKNSTHNGSLLVAMWKTEYAYILFMWCHACVWKTWQSRQSDVNTTFSAKIPAVVS